jgi:hypothetical protein
MKSLYSKPNYRMNDDAFKLNDEVTAAIRPIVKKYEDLGYSPREISHLISLAMIDIELESLIKPE